MFATAAANSTFNRTLQLPFASDEGLHSFWRRNVRLPSHRRNKSRHLVRTRMLPSDTIWLKRDDSLRRGPTQATHISLSQYVGSIDEPRPVRVPAIHVVVSSADWTDHLDHLQAVMREVRLLGLPDPHFVVWDPTDEGALHLLWQIEPLHLPWENRPHEHLVVYNQQYRNLMRCQLKIAAALASLGAEPSLKDHLVPLPHPGPVQHGDPYIVLDNYEQPDFRIRHVSEPLNNTKWDRIAVALLDETNDSSSDDAQVLRMSAGFWLHAPRYLAACEPQPKGKRHNAAKVIVCHERWAGRSSVEIASSLRRWNARLQEPLDDAELFDPKTGLLAWAIENLKKGGPSRTRRPKAEVRGRYTSAHDVDAAVLSYLTTENADQVAWQGTFAELADAVSVELGVPVAVRTLRRRVASALKSHGLTSTKHRIGQRWTTRWTLAQPWKSPNPNSASIRDVRRPKPNRVVAARRALPLSSGLTQDLAQLKFEIGDVGGESISSLQSPLPSFPNQNSDLEIAPTRQKPSKNEISRPTVNDVYVAETPPDLEKSLEHTVWPSAKRLICSGFSLLPITPKGKLPYSRLLPIVDHRPTWLPFARQKPTHEAVLAWFRENPRLNVAVATGRASGAVVLDFDSDEALEWAKAQQLPKPAFRVATGRGEHWYYRYPAGVSRVANRGAFRNRDDIQVRGDGGYVLAPGAVHETGAVYTALDDIDLTAGDEFPVDLVVVEEPDENITPLEARRQRALAVRDGDTVRLRNLPRPTAKEGAADTSTPATSELDKLLQPIRDLVAAGDADAAKAAYLELFADAPFDLRGTLFGMMNDVLRGVR